MSGFKMPPGTGKQPVLLATTSKKPIPSDEVNQLPTKSTAYDARVIAKYFLELAQKEGRLLDPMGIQKLVFFAHGWNLAITGRPLIKQDIEAWDYGPVIDVLYQTFKEFGGGPINRFPPQSLPNTSETQETRELLDRVWEVYKKYSSVQLSNMTHVPGSPWRRARDEGDSLIDNAQIKLYFQEQALEQASAVR